MPVSSTKHCQREPEHQLHDPTNPQRYSYYETWHALKIPADLDLVWAWSLSLTQTCDVAVFTTVHNVQLMPIVAAAYQIWAAPTAMQC